MKLFNVDVIFFLSIVMMHPSFNGTIIVVKGTVVQENKRKMLIAQFCF
jgi:hypothetical protein